MGNPRPPSDPRQDDQQSLRVLFVGPEATAERLAAAGAERDVSFSQMSVDAGMHRVLSATFDCLVLTDETDPDWSVVSTVDAPVVLYGNVDAVQESEAAHGATDLAFEQRDPPDADLLLPAVRAVVGDGPSRRLPAGLDSDTGGEPSAGAFLVASDGTVGWSNVALSKLLPSGATEQLPATSSLYEQFATVFQGTDGRPVGQPGAASEHENELLVTAVGDTDRYYRRYSYPVTTTGAERVELVQDVTDTVDGYDRLALFEDLVENAEDGLFVLDTNWQVEYVNASHAATLGYEPEELVGTHAAQQLSPGEMKRAQAATEALIRGDEESAVVDLTLEDDDGTEFEAAVHFWLRQDESGEYAGLMGVVRDITERVERKRELERYETIIQALGDPVCTFDADGQFVYVNEAFEQQTGYDSETIQGQPATFAMQESAVGTMETLVKTLRTEESRTTGSFEMDLHTDDGQTIPTECQMALLPDDDGTFQGSVAVLRDIREAKRREQRLSKFASIVSHDLRNPLDVAMGRVEVLPDVAEVGPEAETHLEEVYDSLKRMEQLIEDVLVTTHERKGAIESEPVSLDAVATDAWRNVETDDAALRVRDSIELSAHRQRLLRIFENLFRNSVEHSSTAADPGASHDGVVVEVGTLDTDPEHGPTGLYVADNGPGVPADRRDQVFDDGYSTTTGGTGLGLTIVRELAQAHGWTVTVCEGIDGGARFEFTGVALPGDSSE